MKTLFCTDGSTISYNAILNYTKWVKATTIDILNVFDLRHFPDFISLEGNNWDMLCQNSSDMILEHSEKFFKENNLNMGQKIKMCGSAIDNISDILSNYDFVVLGSNNKKGIQKWLGSVSQEVSAISNIPVYISKSENNAKRILFAVDHSESNTNSVNECIKFLQLEGKEIYIATVYEIPSYMFLEGNLDSRWINEVEQKQEKEAVSLLNNIEKKFSDSGYNVKNTFILKGTPEIELINLAKKLNIDLILTGNSNKTALVSFVSGSVSLKILTDTKSDVLIYKQKEDK